MEITTNESLVSKLKAEAEKNKAFSAVCHLFAQRARARQQVTVVSLSRAMRQHGFEFTRDEYTAVLSTLAQLGVGKIDRDPKNRMRALKGINLTLQSIGKAAIEGKPEFSKFSPPVRFRKLPAIVEDTAKKVVAAKSTPKATAKVTSTSSKHITVTVSIGKEKVQFDIPMRLSNVV